MSSNKSKDPTTTGALAKLMATMKANPSLVVDLDTVENLV